MRSEPRNIDLPVSRATRALLTDAGLSDPTCEVTVPPDTTGPHMPLLVRMTLRADLDGQPIEVTYDQHTDRELLEQMDSAEGRTTLQQPVARLLADSAAALDGGAV